MPTDVMGVLQTASRNIAEGRRRPVPLRPGRPPCTVGSERPRSKQLRSKQLVPPLRHAFRGPWRVMVMLALRGELLAPHPLDDRPQHERDESDHREPPGLDAAGDGGPVPYRGAPGPP